MKAVLLCGGLGTRLRPYTYAIPKPMLRLGNKPILEYVIANTRNYGIRDIYITVGYLKAQFRDYFGDGSKFGVNLKIKEEEESLNTAGSILDLKKELNSTFLVQMGDHFSNINLKKMLEFHKKQGGIATIALKRQGVPINYGLAQIDGHKRIFAFEEKPILQNLINSGIYLFEPEIFDFIKPRQDFASDVFPALMKADKKINGYVFDEFWMDIGNTKDYEEMDKSVTLAETVNSLL